MAEQSVTRTVRVHVGEAASALDRERNELATLGDGVVPEDMGPQQIELSIVRPDGSKAMARTGLSRKRIEVMLEHTAELLADFAKLPSADSAGGASAHAKLAGFRKRLGVFPDDLSGAQWQQLGELFVAVGDLECQVARSNPLMAAKELLVVRRALTSRSLGLPQNWQSNCILPRSGFDNDIAVLSPVSPTGELKTVHRPDGRRFVGDVDLHFDGDRMLFSSIGEGNRWHVFECRLDGSEVRQLTPSVPDVDHYDACYVPDGSVIFSSTAPVASVPCVNGSTNIANLYRLAPDGVTIRQLCFDQEHNWCPTVLPNGRILYLRWEYTDTPHSHDRVLFHMNPDGTGQMAYYGSNSYWPNSLFYARPIPGKPNMFVGIVGGHHGVPRMGELVIFDVTRGRREAAGAVQRLPGRGRPVVSDTNPKYGSTLIQDKLVDKSWPKYLHPYPLNETYILTACKPTPTSLWGIYLADRFDNLVLIREL
ncbi:MAG: hypothetical protein KAI66_25085, partial [Lentisphaeria bacterium]|nr:hypothetical protein [Lentisphaeria bacterium]